MATKFLNKLAETISSEIGLVIKQLYAEDSLAFFFYSMEVNKVEQCFGLLSRAASNYKNIPPTLGAKKNGMEN